MIIQNAKKNGRIEVYKVALQEALHSSKPVNPLCFRVPQYSNRVRNLVQVLLHAQKLNRAHVRS